MSATTKKNLLKVSHPILTRVKEYFMMALGMAIYSFGWIGCVLPAKGTSGAASGLAIVISTALHNSFGLDVKIGTLVLLINAVLLLIAGFILGWKFGIKTTFAAIPPLLPFWIPANGVLIATANTGFSMFAPRNRFP